MGTIPPDVNLPKRSLSQSATDRLDRAADAPSGDDNVHGLLHCLLTEFDVLRARIDECDAKDVLLDGFDERVSPVEDVVNRLEDKFRPPSSCTHPRLGMPFKRVACKTFRQHNVNKSIDEATPAAATEAEYPDPVVPTEGPAEVQGRSRWPC